MELNELVELITKLVKERLEALEELENNKNEKVEQVKKAFLDKKVITEADIQKLARQGIIEVVVKFKTIVTPLAQDSMKTYKMKLVKE